MVVLLLIALSGCGGGSGGAASIAAPSIDGASTGDDIPTKAVALAAALEDLQAFAPPSEVDAALFESLRAELGRVLQDLYGGDPVARDARRRMAAIEPADANRAWCLQGKQSASGDVTIKWYGRHVGDYNLDGLVGVADLTPLGFHFDATVELDDIGLPTNDGSNEWIAQVDGDQNGLISVSDITPIGINYDSRMLGYRVYLGSSLDGQALNWDDNFLPCADDAGVPYTLAYNTSRAAGEVHRYSCVFSQPAIPEGAVLHVKVVAWDGTVEGRETTIALPAGPHQALNCELCHRVTDLEYYGDDQTCLLCHRKPSTDDGLDWDDTPGLHHLCMSCHAEHGFAMRPPESGCGACHGDIAVDVAAAGMPDCLGCHEAGHFPEAQPAASACETCHPAPPEDAQAAWDSTPALHNQCYGCHQTHGFTISPPESVCGDCHSSLIAAGHAAGLTECLGCHVHAHLPQLAMTEATCLNCHAVPPENAEASWNDAPGQHAQCGQCHDIADHGDKPVPPESICADCHADLISAGHAGGSTLCFSCHTYAHLPEANISGMDCTECHPVPPENPGASWDDAPGQHDECALCHDETDHGDKPVPPETICGDCHASLISAGHAGGITLCLSCHDYAHLPEADISGTDCTNCHATPPEDPSASWDDAPGQHAECAQCHDETDHGDKPVPPETICGDCHADLIAAEHAGGTTLCLVCHTHPHLPNTDVSGQECLSCHAVPPEDPSAFWSDAPGQHDQCELCHDAADHGDKPVPPESICGDCHGEFIAMGHAGGATLCRDCHTYPHLPEAQLSPSDCVICHTEPPEESSAEWEDAPGQHAICERCHLTADHGDKPIPPQSVCGDCHGALIAGGHAWGRPVCLDCHTHPHLPISDFSEWACADCHWTPPEDPEADWDDAPGQHDQCGLCHDAADHGDIPVPPESICADCHAGLISGGHAGGITLCLGCHTYAHLPVTDFSEWDCADCHSAPPEDPTASWDDAPGQHDQCSMCHDDDDHGDKPVPPESICGDCHADLISAGHAWGSSLCLSCHAWPHLPVTDFSDWDCTDCHTAPPEDLEASWDDAPDQHDQCALCHDETDHGDKPIPPQSICTSCHDDVSGGGHPGPGANCMMCHDYAHLPVVP